MEDDKYIQGREAGKIVFDQLAEQGISAGHACLIGLEIAALGLENDGMPATRNAKLGAARMFIHRIIDGVFIDPKTHPEATCEICAMTKGLV
jgi:hypothetical protein